jgi:hypothetical protein
MLPTARMAAWGGLMTAVKWLIPNMPRFEIEKVPIYAIRRMEGTKTACTSATQEIQKVEK